MTLAYRYSNLKTRMLLLNEKKSFRGVAIFLYSVTGFAFPAVKNVRSACNVKTKIKIDMRNWKYVGKAGLLPSFATGRGHYFYVYFLLFGDRTSTDARATGSNVQHRYCTLDGTRAFDKVAANPLTRRRRLRSPSLRSHLLDRSSRASAERARSLI